MDDLKRKATSTKLASGLALAYFLVNSDQHWCAVVVFGIYAGSELAEKWTKTKPKKGK